MSIMNRRNALVGWLTWITAKRVLKQKAKQAAQGESSHRVRNVMLAGAAAVAGLVWFWHRQDSEDEFDDPTVAADLDES